MIRYYSFWIEKPSESFLEKFSKAFDRNESRVKSQSSSKELSTSYSEDSELLLIDSILPYFKNKNDIPLILHLQVNQTNSDGVLSR